MVLEFASSVWPRGNGDGVPVMRLAAIAIAGVVQIFVCTAVFAGPALSDGEVRDRIIQESLRGYSGSCPCPYNIMRNGRECGERSAYSKPGGASPLCYPKDVPDDMVRQYRRRNGQ